MAEDDAWIRVRVRDAELLAKWKQALDSAKISQQDAVIGMIETALDLDPVVRPYFFRQTPSTDRELMRFLLARYADDGGRRKPK